MMAADNMSEDPREAGKEPRERTGDRAPGAAYEPPAYSKLPASYSGSSASIEGGMRSVAPPASVLMPTHILADIVLALWRTKQKLIDPASGEPLEELRAIYRPVERVLRELEDLGIEARSHTGQDYVAGMALRVLAFQPTPDVERDIITETLKPSIYVRERLIAMGEVIVSTR